MLTPGEKSPQLEKFSPEKYQTHNAASSRTASQTHYQSAIPAPESAVIIKDIRHQPVWLPCSEPGHGASRCSGDKVFSPLFQVPCHCHLLCCHDVVQCQEVFLQTVDQWDREFLINSLFLCHHNQSVKETKIQ